jgi:hypothetical protein
MGRGLTRVVGYLWAAPITFIGIAIAMAAWRRGQVALVDGVIEVHGPWVRWALRHLVPLRGGASAITFGHVVLARDQASLDCTRTHERVHVRQYERWGALFVPAYLTAGLWAALRGGHPYFDNPFEREAYDAE